jgi:hypothetical protein
MKNILYCFLLSLVLSSCALGLTTSIYSISGGKVKVPQKETYTVVYQASFGSGLTADVAYTNEVGKEVELKEVSGAWEKTVTLKSGTHAKLKTLATANTASRGEYKIFVDGKVVSEYVLSGKRLNYTFSFDLP